MEERERMGAVDPVPAEGALVAATAKVCGMAFVTRNVADGRVLASPERSPLTGTHPSAQGTPIQPARAGEN